MAKDPTEPIGLWGWIWRTFAVLLVSAFLYLGDGRYLDLGKLADTATVLLPVMAVWSIVDQRILSFIVRRVRAIIRALDDLRNRKRTEAEAAPVETALDGEHAADEVQTEASEVGDISPWPWLRALAAFGLILLLALAAFSAVKFLIDSIPVSKTVPAQTPPSSPPTMPPSVQPSGPPAPSPAPARTYRVPKDGSCWATARLFTCEGSRWRELGPPLNDIKIERRDCPLREGRVLSIPADWPDACPGKR